MANQNSNFRHPDETAGVGRSPGSVTKNIFAVFPDGSILWDVSEGSVDGSIKDSNRTLDHAPSGSTERSASLLIDPPKSISVPTGTSQAVADHAVQYHVHYHLLNGNRLLVAFLAGGAIALGLGAFYVQYQVPISPSAMPSLEQRHN